MNLIDALKRQDTFNDGLSQLRLNLEAIVEQLTGEQVPQPKESVNGTPTPGMLGKLEELQDRTAYLGMQCSTAVSILQNKLLYEAPSKTEVGSDAKGAINTEFEYNLKRSV